MTTRNWTGRFCVLLYRSSYSGTSYSLLLERMCTDLVIEDDPCVSLAWNPCPLTFDANESEQKQMGVEHHKHPGILLVLSNPGRYSFVRCGARCWDVAVTEDGRHGALEGSCADDHHQRSGTQVSFTL